MFELRQNKELRHKKLLLVVDRLAVCRILADIQLLVVKWDCLVLKL